MKISTTIKTKKGKYFWIDTISISNNPYIEWINIIDKTGFGNSNAIGKNFETMVFHCNEKGIVTDWKELDVENYNTEEEAIEGHKIMCKKWSKK